MDLLNGVVPPLPTLSAYYFHLLFINPSFILILQILFFKKKKSSSDPLPEEEEEEEALLVALALPGKVRR